MKRLNSNVGPAQGSLQERPEVFQAICVDATPDIGFGMIHHIMHKAIAESLVSNRIIGVNGRAVLYVLQNLVLQSLALNIRNYCGSDLASIAVRDALHDGFAFEFLT